MSLGMWCRLGMFALVQGCGQLAGVEGSPEDVTLRPGTHPNGYDLEECNRGRTWRVNTPGEPAGRVQVEGIIYDVGVESLFEVGVEPSECGDPEDLVSAAAVSDWADVDPLVQGIGDRLRTARLGAVIEVSVKSP